MAVSFKDLLSKKADDAKPPVAYPAGHYYGKLGKYSLGDNNRNKTPYVRYVVTATGLGDDIDQEEFSTLGLKLGEKQFRLDFFLTPDSEYRLTEFMQSIGLDTAGRSFAELLPETVGADILFELSMQPAQGRDGSEQEGRFVNFITGATGVKEAA